MVGMVTPEFDSVGSRLEEPLYYLGTKKTGFHAQRGHIAFNRHGDTAA